MRFISTICFKNRLENTLFFQGLFFFSLFFFYSANLAGSEAAYICKEDDDSDYCTRAREQHEWAREDRDRKARKAEEDRTHRARKAEEDRARRARDQEREQARTANQKERQRQERCDKVAREAKTALQKQKDETQKWEEKFFDMEEKITDLEKKHSENKMTLNEKLEELKTNSNKTVQDLKTEMGDELKELEEQIGEVEESIAQLFEALETVEEGRLDTHFARRKQQNEFYSRCFGQALEQTEKERTLYYQRKTAGSLRKKSLGQLISGGKGQVKSQFSERFNSFLNLCLNNQAALLEKKNQRDEYKLMLEKLNKKEERAKAQIAGSKSKITNLKTKSKMEVMNKFKEKMTAELNSFSQSYDSLTKNFQESSKQTIAEIEKIKKRQAYILMNRSQATSQDTRSLLLNGNCQEGLDAFNLFPRSWKINPLSPPALTGGIK